MPPSTDHKVARSFHVSIFVVGTSAIFGLKLFKWTIMKRFKVNSIFGSGSYSICYYIVTNTHTYKCICLLSIYSWNGPNPFLINVVMEHLIWDLHWKSEKFLSFLHSIPWKRPTLDFDGFWFRQNLNRHYSIHCGTYCL